jgi:PiT family inorganic phosphate transporter
MLSSNPLLVVLTGLALAFAFLNGFHDSANIVSAVISSRSMRPRFALLLAAFSVMLGPFIFGVAVARTVGADLLDPRALEPAVIIAALLAGILWNLITWYFGLPSSSSHALLGGLLGSSLVVAGPAVIRLGGLQTILIALVLSPIVGLAAGFLLLRLLIQLLKNATPRVNRYLRRAQVLTLIGLGLSHGSNDGQKTIAVLALSLVATGAVDQFSAPAWVVASSAAAMSLGMSIGGWRLIRTLGGRLYRIRPIHGLASQLAGSGVILGAALLGGPVSTTQVMSASILGAGAGQRVNQVRWMVLREMIWGWLLTIPASGAMAALLAFVLTRFG